MAAAAAKPPCFKWNAGSCDRGKACPYAHDPSAKGKAKAKAKQGPGPPKSTPKGGGTVGTTSPKVCWEWQDGQKCPRKNCPFQHRKATPEERAEMQQKRSSSAGSSKRSASPGGPKAPCRHWAKEGACHFGDRCHFQYKAKGKAKGKAKPKVKASS